MKVIKFIKKVARLYCERAMISGLAYPTGTVPTRV